MDAVVSDMGPNNMKAERIWNLESTLIVNPALPTRSISSSPVPHFPKPPTNILIDRGLIYNDVINHKQPFTE